MDEPRLDQRREWSGEWWLPTAPEQTFAGVLTFDPGEELSLRLIGGWPYTESAESAPGLHIGGGELLRWPIVHGRAGAIALTLQDVRVTEARGGDDDRPDGLSLGATTLLVGIHLGSEADDAFISAQVTTENLTEWSRRTGFRREGPAGLSTERLEPLEATAGDLTVRLHTFSTRRYGHRKRDGRYMSFSEHAVMEFESETLRPMDAFFESIRSVSDLMTLSTLTPCADITVCLFTPPIRDRYPKDHVSATGPHRVDVYQVRALTPKPNENGPGWFDFILSLEDQPFEDLIPRWVDLRKTFKAALDQVLGLTYLPGGYLQTRVVSAVSAAEAFHRALSLAPPLPEAEHSSLRKLLFDVVPDEHRQWLHDRIRYNQPTLRQRLVDLARRPGPFMENLVPDPGAWAKSAANSRDGVAHFGTAGHSRYEELHAIVKVTAAVVTMNLLSEIGIPQDRLRRALHDNRDLRWTCELARVHFGDQIGVEGSSI